MSVSGRSARLGGLVAGVSYEVVVTGVNGNGAGAPSTSAAVPLESPCALAGVVDQAQAALVGDCEALWAQRKASAYDPEDGALDGSAIMWSSDIDGAVAIGGRAVIDTGDLSVGTHALTATASDTSASSGTATVTITVSASNDAPIAADDTGYTRADSAVLVNVVANDTDAESDIDPYSLSVVVPPAAGTAAAVHNTAGNVAAIEYVSASPGIDTLIYEICDAARQCATAELTVVAAASR